MEINDLFGLPAHPLLVHIPVVLIPLATVGSLLVAIRASWRRTFAIPVAVIAIVGAGGVFLAAKSGGSLEERVKETDLVHDHAAAGERAEPWAALYGIFAVGLAAADWIDRRNRGRVAPSVAPASGADDGAPGGGAVSGGTATATSTVTSAATTTTSRTTIPPSGRTVLTTVVPVLAVVTLLLGGVASSVVYVAGHSGAKATWHATPGSNAESERGEHRDGDGG